MSRILRLALAFAVVGLAFAAAPAVASEDTDPPLHDVEESQQRSFSTGTAFFDDGKITGSLYYFQRKRMRESLSDDRYHNNLDHATYGIGAEFSSGFIGDFIGVDIGAFTATDLWHSKLPYHELSFFPTRDPWSNNWDSQYPDNGVSLHKALVKFRHKSTWAKAGYFQPTGPGTLGVNWSVYPGTYRGAEAGFTHGGLSVAAAWADQYKAPWFRDTYHLRRDDGSHVSYLWSLGARYTFDETSFLAGTTVELAYGESKNFLQNGHFKIKNTRPLGEGTFTAGYQLYAMADSASHGANDNFAGNAYQHFVFSRYEYGPWTFRAEFTYTEAPQKNATNKGYFAYRLISRYGGSQGAIEPDWNTRSDWNHNREKAAFANVSRKFSILGHKGFEAGVTYSHGWDGKAHGYSGHLKEWAWAVDLSYTVPEGMFEGTTIKAHYMEYTNSSDRPDWEGFQNAFQDERDFKLLVVIPFSF
ncbi:MAG: Chitoporin [Desulfovibrio sp.]